MTVHLSRSVHVAGSLPAVSCIQPQALQLTSPGLYMYSPTSLTVHLSRSVHVAGSLLAVSCIHPQA